MFRKIMLMVIFSLVSCTQNLDLATYQVGDQTITLKSKTAMENFEKIFGQVDPQGMEYAISDSETLKLVIQSQTFEQDLFILEAQKLSNYQDDITFIDTVEYKKHSLPLELSAQDGMDIISNDSMNQVVEISEISRIMFTNNILNNGQSIEGLLAELVNSEMPVRDFGLKAEEYSHEFLGAQNGGYLAHVMKGQFPVIDEIVFDQKFTGIYPEVVTDNVGSYLIFVHSPVRKIKVSDFEVEGISADPNYIMVNYVNNNVEYLYTMNAPDSITINGQQKNISDIDKNEKIVKIWGKTYTIQQVIDQLLILMGGKPETELSIENMFAFIAPTQNGVSSALQQMAVIAKGDNKNREKSKEYQKTLEDSIREYELNIAFNIVMAEVFKDVSTNVSTEEMLEFYSYEGNRQIKSYSDAGEPIFATLKESEEYIVQSILGMRAEQIRMQHSNYLKEEYSVVWNEENLSKFAVELQKKYDKYAFDNDINMSEEY